MVRLATERLVCLALAALLLAVAISPALVGAGPLPIPEDPMDPLAQNDAGSGRDAPRSGPSSDAVSLEPGRVYEANATGPGLDQTDWYRFEAESGVAFHFLAWSSGAVCLYLVDADGFAPENTCADGAALMGEFTYVLNRTGRWYIRVSALAPSNYRISFSLGGAAPDPNGNPQTPLSDPLMEANAHLAREDCQAADPSEATATHGTGDVGIPSLTWAALKTGYRAVVVWSGEQATTGTLEILGRDGSIVAVPQEGPAGQHHVFILDRLRIGDVLCFRVVERMPGDATGTPIVSSAWHALRLANAHTAYDPDEGVYTANLLLLMNENLYDRAVYQAAFDVFARKLWDATDGHVRAGALIALYGDIDHASTGAYSCYLPSALGVYAAARPPTCPSLTDVVFSYENAPGTSGLTAKDGIMDPGAFINLNNFDESPLGLPSLDLPWEVGSVLLHEFGHYAFGADDLYTAASQAGEDCYDPATGISIMGLNRDATEFDDEVARCPNEETIKTLSTQMRYTPTWTYLRARYDAIPDRPNGPVPGPEGDGGVVHQHHFEMLPEALAQNDGGSGRDAPETADSSQVTTVEPGTVVDGVLLGLVVDDTDFYAFEGTAGSWLDLRFDSPEGAPCLHVLRPDGTELDYTCAFAAAVPGQLTLHLDDTGTWAIELVSLSPATYQFLFTLDAPAPPLGLLWGALPSDNDADSGLDAPNEGPNPLAIPVSAGRVYRGQMLTTVTDYGDWFQFDAPAGGVLNLRLASPDRTCATVVDADGLDVAEACATAADMQGILLSAPLPGPGTYYLDWFSTARSTYAFAFALNGDPPPIEA